MKVNYLFKNNFDLQKRKVIEHWDLILFIRIKIVIVEMESVGSQFILISG